MREPSLRNSPEYIIGEAILKAIHDPDPNVSEWFISDNPTTSLTEEIGYFLWWRLTPRRREIVSRALGYPLKKRSPEPEPMPKKIGDDSDIPF